MQEDLTLDRPMTREQEIALKNRRTGMNIFQLSWIMVFVCLVIVNWQLRFTATTWPPEGIQRLDRFLPTLGTFGLIASAVLARRALMTINAPVYDLRGFLIQWRGVLLLGAAFVLIMAYEWVTLPPIPQTTLTLADGSQVTGDSTQFNAVFRLMTAFHGFHALVIGLFMFRVMRSAQYGAYKPTSRHPVVDTWDVEAGVKLWYFVVFAWIMFYVVLYWI